jgi:hypothetical protein
MQRFVALVTVVLCAAQPSACESGMYVQAPPLVDAPSTTSIPMPEPEVTLIELPEAEAWRRVKSTLGSRVAVLRPATLPERFANSTVMLEYAYMAGDQVPYRVGYRTEGALLLFAAGAVNSSEQTSTERIDVRGVAGQYSTSLDWPERQIQWVERTTWSGDDASAASSKVLYSIQSRGVSEAELRSIASALRAVP